MGRIIESLTLDGKNTEFEEFCDDCGPNQKRWVLICFSITVKMFAHSICGYDYIFYDMKNFLCYHPLTKLLKGNVFTSVCQVFCPQGRGVHPLGRHNPRQTQTQADTSLARPSGQTLQGDTPADGYCSRRYASYWNAFSLLMQMSKSVFWGILKERCQVVMVIKAFSANLTFQI